MRNIAQSPETLQKLRDDPYYEIWDCDYYSTTDEEDEDDEEDSSSSSEEDEQQPESQQNTPSSKSRGMKKSAKQKSQ